MVRSTIANLSGWAAHLEGIFINPIQRIAQSTFYDYIERDSTIIISNLDAISQFYLGQRQADRHFQPPRHTGVPAGTDMRTSCRTGAR